MNQLIIKLTALTVFLFIVTVYLSQVIFKANLQLASYNAQLTKLDSYNKELVIHSANLESYDQVVKKAKALGFVNTAPIIYLDQSVVAKYDQI